MVARLHDYTITREPDAHVRQMARSIVNTSPIAPLRGSPRRPACTDVNAPAGQRRPQAAGAVPARTLLAVAFAVVGVGVLVWVIDPSFLHRRKPVPLGPAPAKPVTRSYDLKPAPQTVATDLERVRVAIAQKGDLPSGLAEATVRTLRWLLTGSRGLYDKRPKACPQRKDVVSDDAWRMQTAGFINAPLNTEQLEVRLRVRRGKPLPAPESGQTGFRKTSYAAPRNRPGCLDPQRQGLDVYEVVLPMQVRDPQGRPLDVRVGLWYSYDPRQSAWVLVSINLYDVPGDTMVLAPFP